MNRLIIMIRGFKVLERCAMKVACTVLRGGKPGNRFLLPDINGAQYIATLRAKYKSDLWYKVINTINNECLAS